MEKNINPKEINQVEYAKLNPPFRAPLVTMHFGTWRRAMSIVESTMKKLEVKEPPAKKPAPKVVKQESNGEV